MDYELGRVMDALKASAYSDNTYIICFSDHGWNLGEKEHWGKAASDPHEFDNLAVTDQKNQLVQNTLKTQRTTLQELLKPHKL